MKKLFIISLVLLAVAAIVTISGALTANVPQTQFGYGLALAGIITHSLYEVRKAHMKSRNPYIDLRK
jgi:uncharacterized protein YxeA